MEERPCPDLHDCIGEIHGLMYTAMWTEPDANFAYALWVNDDDGSFPCYVIQKDLDHPGCVINMMTPDVWDLFESVGGQEWHENILEIISDPREG